MNVVLIGMKHCGKSTLGRRLARRWNCAFYDVDDLIVELHACHSGERLSVREIVARHGDAHFERLESDAVCDLVLKFTAPGAPRAVAALGGRTAANPRIRDLLDTLGTVVYLRADPTIVLARILAGGVPPFLEGDETGERFMRIWRERIVAYQRLADVTLDVRGLDIDEATAALLAELKELDDGGQ